MAYGDAVVGELLDVRRIAAFNVDPFELGHMEVRHVLKRRAVFVRVVSEPQTAHDYVAVRGCHGGERRGLRDLAERLRQRLHAPQTNN
ncbi:MAG: hypothetical protein QGH31_09200 [Kiritimatiellia bacterium]|jgi:hypothetical protein|nr:hypothetical protein [Kiritimatiellia bacterium]